MPALGALAAEPLYLLVDTAIVGTWGPPSSRRSRSRGRCWGIVGVWIGLLGLIVTLATRFAGGRWAVTGAPA